MWKCSRGNIKWLSSLWFPIVCLFSFFSSSFRYLSSQNKIWGNVTLCWVGNCICLKLAVSHLLHPHTRQDESYICAKEPLSWWCDFQSIWVTLASSCATSYFSNPDEEVSNPEIQQSLSYYFPGKCVSFLLYLYKLTALKYSEKHFNPKIACCW